MFSTPAPAGLETPPGRPLQHVRGTAQRGGSHHLEWCSVPARARLASTPPRAAGRVRPVPLATHATWALLPPRSAVQGATLYSRPQVVQTAPLGTPAPRVPSLRRLSSTRVRPASSVAPPVQLRAATVARVTRALVTRPPTGQLCFAPRGRTALPAPLVAPHVMLVYLEILLVQ